MVVVRVRVVEVLGTWVAWEFVFLAAGTTRRMQILALVVCVNVRVRVRVYALTRICSSGARETMVGTRKNTRDKRTLCDFPFDADRIRYACACACACALDRYSLPSDRDTLRKIRKGTKV